MKKKILLIVAICTLTNLQICTFANNLTISAIAVTQPVAPAAPGGTVSFNVAWDNSWNIAAAPSNWDAVWLFVKFRDCAAASSAAYTHGTINATKANHSFGTLEPMTTGDGATPSAGTGSVVQGAALDYSGATGIMVRRSTNGSGSFSSAVTLRIDNLPNDATTLTTSVYGIEMVYCPQGDFYIGDGDGITGSNSNYHFLNAAVGTAGPMQITSAFETAASTLIVGWGPTTINNVSATFPKGQYGFYIMKHEISQGLYAEFLNCLGLSSAAQIARYLGNVGTNRNQTQLVGSTFLSTRPERAQNFIGWRDFSAFCDWACLRPLTELEYEKAARGLFAIVTNEYPWGMAGIGAISQGNTFTAPGTETGTETVTGGNAVYGGNNPTWTNGDGGQGPGRVGIFATALTTRQTAGAGYYGALEMAGNLREFYIGVHSTGASNTFTRTWGNGAVDANGDHDVAGGWPTAAYATGWGVATNLVGQRGGSWQSGAVYLQTSDRYEIPYPNSGGGISARYATSGGRAGR